MDERTYCSNRFRPEKKSTLSTVADMLGAAGGFAGKYSNIITNNMQLHALSVPQYQRTQQDINNV